jgi:hypothetical protein
MGLWIIMGITLGLSLVMTAVSQSQALLRKRYGGVSPITQPSAAAPLDAHDDHDDESASARQSVDLPANLEAKIAAGQAADRPAVGGIAAYRSDAVAEIAVAAANFGKRVSFGGAPPAAVSSGAGSMQQQQQQQQAPRLAAQLYSPTGQGPGRTADSAAAAAAARGQGFIPHHADGVAALTARHVALEHKAPASGLAAQPPGMQQYAPEEKENADAVLML